MMSYVMFARWFGIISVILALGILFNLGDARKMARSMLETDSGYIMGGVLPIIFGSLAFMHVNSFQISWEIVVTGIGLLMLLAGLCRVIFVKAWKKLIQQHLDKVPALFSLFGLILGLLLVYIGFIAPAVDYPFMH